MKRVGALLRCAVINFEIDKNKENKLKIKEEEIIKVEETDDVPGNEEVVDTVEVVEQPKELTKEECARLISKDKVLEIVNTAFSKYQGKVVLAMEEVRTMVNEIVYAVNE